MTTLLKFVVKDIQGQGSGFFYQELAPHDPTKPGWIVVNNTWIVTNRHVLLPKINGIETIPDKFIFNLRKNVGGKISWYPIVIEKEEFIKRAKFHSNATVDVGILEVFDLIKNVLNKEGDTIMNYSPVSKEKFVGNNNIQVESSDDIIVIGYPKEFYDEYNVFPIIKSGIIASRWGSNFGGEPCFLIDAKLFPGSSGSIVLSKPIDMVVVNDQILHAKEKQFAFLGIFSGEPVKLEQQIETDSMTIQLKTSFNVGVVWYAHLVEEIIKNGKPINVS